MNLPPDGADDAGYEDTVASASAVFEQLIDAVDGPRVRSQQVRQPRQSLSGVGSGPANGDAGLSEIRVAMMQSVDLFSDLFQRVLGVYADAVLSRLEPPGGAGDDDANTTIQMSGRAGSTARARLWVHNTTPDPIRSIRPRLTDLFAHDGWVLPAAAGFDPAVVEAEGGHSVSTWLEITIPEGVPTGTYHGLALANGLPEAAVPVRLTVVT